MILKIKKVHPNAKMPTYESDGAACFDLYAATINGAAHIGDIVYEGHPAIIDTGLAVEVPPGYMMQIRSRSGLAFRNNIRAFPGTIDSDYRGAIKILLTCDYLAEEDPPTKINIGDRIAQACLVPVPRCEFVEVETLGETARGAGGFGSTGA